MGLRHLVLGMLKAKQARQQVSRYLDGCRLIEGCGKQDRLNWKQAHFWEWERWYRKGMRINVYLVNLPICAMKSPFQSRGMYHERSQNPYGIFFCQLYFLKDIMVSESEDPIARNSLRKAETRRGE